MEVDFAFLCDYAEISGKINALGIGLENIYTTELPVTHPLMHLVAQFRANITEAGRKELKIQMINADGNVITSIESPIEIRSPEAGVEAVARVDAALNNVEFEHYGDYSIHILIDGNEMKSIGFKVVAPAETS